MHDPFTKLLRRFCRDDAAPSAIEYALLVAGVGVIIIAVVYMLGANVRSGLDRASPHAPPTTPSTSPSP
jgi:Flp pilus assembly pilin Flp